MFTEGQKVLWSYTTPSYYNWVIEVKAQVIKVNPKTIRIKAFKKDGTWNERSVKPENLKACEWENI